MGEINKRPILKFKQEERETIFRDMAEHSAKGNPYPCDVCEHPDHDGGAMECAHKACAKWLKWYRKEWRVTTKTLQELLK